MTVPGGLDVDFQRTPFTVIWEVTRACALRCVHCRADANSARDPRELRTEEGYVLLDQVRDLGSPVLVITGGDPLERPDLFELLGYAVANGLSVAVTPSATPRLTRFAIERMQELGVRRMALSLDGPTAEIHDAFRQQAGSYSWTLQGLNHARACGLPVQINTTVTRRNLVVLPQIADVVAQVGAVMWSVFFLVTVGRAQRDDQLTAAECEDVFAFLHGLSLCAPFAVRTAAAPHYRRFVLQQERLCKNGRPLARRPSGGLGTGPVAGMARASRGVTDGSGLVFVSHTGEVYPSGFLPVSCGNIRAQPLADIYRNAPLLRRLRDPDALGGKCGRCQFRRVCAGSRARAFAVRGDPLAEDPLCAYQPGA
jgi:radical SAM protein